jgi:serine/threonine-protein kinase RsbW
MKQIANLRFKAVLENVSTAIDCVTKSAREAGFDEEITYQLQLAVDEACANVIHHAYEGMEPGDIEVTCSCDDQHLVIRVHDWGKSFVPEHVPEPDVDAPLEERSLGGLGLFLIRQCMDQVEFAFDAELGNELTMTKRLQGAEPSCQKPN